MERRERKMRREKKRENEKRVREKGREPQRGEQRGKHGEENTGRRIEREESDSRARGEEKRGESKDDLQSVDRDK